MTNTSLRFSNTGKR